MIRTPDATRPNLVFPPAPQPQGFSTLATEQWTGNPEPVVRELLQNCLDAAEAAGRGADVRFTIRDVPRDRIPGIEAYEEHFRAAVKQRKKGRQGEAEKRTIERIAGLLDESRIPILCCTDNGVGLNVDRMNGLLSEGNTDKTEGQAGAFGLGHLTAFAASGLRYVFYAGRSVPDKDGVVTEIAGGHAILASRRMDEGGRSGHGWWLTGAEPDLFSHRPFPAEIPSMLNPERDLIQDTGTIVCVLGFDEDFADAAAIARVAAKNFLVAIWRGRMKVTISDEREARRRTVAVNEKSLGRTLAPLMSRKRAATGGWLPGQQANWAYATLRGGEDRRLLDGQVAVRFRKLPETGRNRRSRAQLFRSGMWITNAADWLLPRDFNGVNPFDAVVLADKGRFAELVRGAEGPEHRGLSRKRLQRRENEELAKLLKRIGRELRELAGEVDAEAEFDSDIVTFDVRRRAEKIVRRRRVIDSKPAPPPNVNPKKPEPKSKKRNRGRPPPGGRGVRVRTSVRVLEDARILRVAWRVRRGAPPNLRFRVRISSGSDVTCVRPVSPEWISIKEILVPDGDAPHGYRVVVPDGDGFEAALPSGGFGTFDVLLDDPVPDANAVEIDVVFRKKTVARQRSGEVAS